MKAPALSAAPKSYAPWRLTNQDIDDAYKSGFVFNCGPAAVCAACSIGPAWVKPHFEKAGYLKKNYTNPTMMLEILDSLRVLGDVIKKEPSKERPETGIWDSWPAALRTIIRVQFGGPWCKAGVHPSARYSHTHWIATYCKVPFSAQQTAVFDINNPGEGGPAWVTAGYWINFVVPDIIKHCEPHCTGDFWPTHIIKVVV